MKKIKYIVSCGTLFLLGTLPFVLSAQAGDSPPKIENPFSGGTTLMDLVKTVLNNVVMPIAAVASVFYIILAGFKYVMAQGKPAEIQKANDNLLYALIGVGILLGAAGISGVIQTTVNSLIK